MIERAWTALEEEELASKGALSKRILGENERFSPVTWEHSHVVMDEDGQLKSFCVYSSPNTELIREHAALLGDHKVDGIYEIGGDISPADFV
ncbi:MAG TPA: nickel-binding protein [Solirubrobacteraceae bacterium]